MIREADVDGGIFLFRWSIIPSFAFWDGQINYEEFVKMMMAKRSRNLREAEDLFYAVVNQAIAKIEEGKYTENRDV